MVYTYLAAWVSEHVDFTASIEACYQLDERLILVLKGGEKLCFVLSASDSFPYITQDRLFLDGAKSMMQGLKNAQITGVSIAESDRILYVNIMHRDIYQQNTEYVLVAELMPPQANVIWCIKKEGKLHIMDALRKYTYAENPQRQVLAGLPYVPPKTSFTPDKQQMQAPYPDGSMDCNTYFRKRFEEVILNRRTDQLLLSQAAQLKREIKKLQKKLKLQQMDLADAAKADYWRDCAEGLKPNLKSISAGQTSFTTINYYDAELKEITIPLLADKNAHDNMQHYMKKFQKAKKGFAIITQNIVKTQTEIASTEELLARTEAGEELDLNLKTGSSAVQMIQKASMIDKLLSLKVNDDWQIVIGRKAKENDFITTQLGRPHDWWFHSRIYHGAHVLLRCLKKKEPTPELIRHCCNLAAWYSQAKHSANVPVDYTQIRFVRKPRKAAPGYVTYTNHHSIYATPMDLREVREALHL
ncbi:MAG: NFACT RNA binding domain-containing protein [Candidatus Cloacimonetes bacterium]|nr:NFACT RNA binding domain-containing protein [Candidatus Cloacimonadota bacterium]